MKAVYLFVGVTLMLSAATTAAQRLMLIDSGQEERYAYQPFMTAAKAAHLTFDYLCAAQILDLPEKKLAQLPQQYRGAFFIFRPEFLKKINTDAAAISKIVGLVTAFCNQPQALIGIIMPPTRVGLSTLQSLVIGDSAQTTSHEHQAALNALQTVVQQSLTTPLEKRNRRYETTLLPTQSPQAPVAWAVNDPKIVALLPMQGAYAHEIQSLFPLGIYWYNPLKKNHLFFAQSSLISCLGIAENMWLCPTEPLLKTQLLMALQQTMHELANLSSNAGGTKNDLSTAIPAHRSLPITTATNKQRTSKKMKCAWMGIELFEDEEKKAEQATLLEYILASNVTHLWLTISPNWYYSPIAQRTEHKQTMLKGVERFTHQLTTVAQRANQQVPKLMIGFEIAYNYAKHAQSPVTDLYGNQYRDLPSPLDAQFWHNELVLPLQQFLLDWKKLSPIPIAGIMLDLEMYGRASGAFLSTMHLDHASLERITKKKGSPGTIDGLIDHQLVGRYFKQLYHQSVQTGKNVAHSLRTVLPDLEIGCYAPTLFQGWFYKGFYRGLSAQENKLLLLTFNSEFVTYKKWFKKNKINAHHLSALLFSKITNEGDFKKVDALLQQHDGVWLNRFNWLAEPYKKEVWYEIESTPMNQAQRKLFMHYLGSR